QVPGIPPTPPPPNSQNNVNRQTRPTFSMTMSQTIVNVSVTDRNGKPVEHLTKNDFELYEDGKLQTLQACEFEHLGTTPLPSLNPATQFAQRQPLPAAAGAPQSAASSGALSKFQDRRLIVMLFDFSSMEAAEQVRARDAALKFLSTQMTASDVVSIMVFGSELKTVQEFTSDRDQLTSVIQRFHIGEASDLAAT